MKRSGDYRFGIGVPTLLMLCAVLALTTLGILTYTSGRANLALTDRTVQMTQAYYEAAARAQEQLARLDADLTDMRASADTDDAYRSMIDEYAAGEGMACDGMTLSFAIAADGGRELSLQAEIAPLSDAGARFTLVRHALVAADLIDDEAPLNIYH